MHLLVPGAYRRLDRGRPTRTLCRLNAPSGAGCLPTAHQENSSPDGLVSMHLLVPGAYRPLVRWASAKAGVRLNAPSGAGCLPTSVRWTSAKAGVVSMHLLVPGAYRQEGGSMSIASEMSQCTFWCRVLTDRNGCLLQPRRGCVSMHLLVPGAYRRPERRGCVCILCSLNAPSGAGCLPTAVSANRVAATFTRR